MGKRFEQITQSVPEDVAKMVLKAKKMMFNITNSHKNVH